MGGKQRIPYLSRVPAHEHVYAHSNTAPHAFAHAPNDVPSGFSQNHRRGRQVRRMRALARCYGQRPVGIRRSPYRCLVALGGGAPRAAQAAAAAATTTAAMATHPAGRTLEALSFDNLTLRTLPVETGDNRPRQVEGACFSRVQPTPVSKPVLVVASAEALALLDIDPAEVRRSSGGRAGWAWLGSEPCTARVNQDPHVRNLAAVLW